MADELFIPEFKADSSSTKDKIVQILADSPGIKTKRIHFLLKKKYGVQVTYQAVHKLVKQMSSHGVVVEEERKYMINSNWIHELKHFIRSVEKNVGTNAASESKIIHQKINPNLEIIELNTLQEAEDYFFRFREEYFNNVEKIDPKYRILCLHAPHLYIALLSPNKEFEFMDRLIQNKTKHYTLCRGDTVVERWIQRFYNSKKGQPYTVKIGANCSSMNETWLYPDKLIEVYFSQKFWKFYDDLYKSIESIDEINYSSIIEKLYLLKKEPFKIIIHKDPSLIKIARDETLEQFGIGKKTIEIVEKHPRSNGGFISNKERFNEMRNTYAAYSDSFKTFIKKLEKTVDEDQKILLNDYVIGRIGAKAGIRAYILRKFMEIVGVDWKQHIKLLGYVELHLASMYCFNAGADNKTSFDFPKKIFFSVKDIIRKQLFTEVSNEYGKEIEEIFRDTDKRCYMGLVLDTIIDSVESYGQENKKIYAKIKKNYDYNQSGIEIGIIEKAFKEYELIKKNKHKIFYYERTYGLNSVMIENLAKIAFILSEKKDAKTLSAMMGYGKYYGLSNMIINDIQDFSLDIVDTKIPTREKEKTDVYADLANGYITWVINYGIKNKKLRELTLKLLKGKFEKSEYEVIRKKYINENIFKKALCDSIGYAQIAVSKINRITNEKNQRNIDMLKDLVISTAKGSKYVKLLEKKYGVGIRMSQAEYKLIKRKVHENPEQSKKLIKSMKFCDTILDSLAS
ncbi:MAG: hypothetical protein KKF44_05550 [Nanoarchaeota archaeon]|nr:hypothetical protein [Nanoarchaeota archaeon]